MKKQLISFFVSLSISASPFAATENMVWGDVGQALPQFKAEGKVNLRGLSSVMKNQKEAAYELKLNENAQSSNEHTRYQLYYKGLPVLGHQMIFHKKAGAKDFVTGTNVVGIEKDVKSLSPKLSESEVEKNIFSSIKEKIKFKTITRVIFIDEDKKAHLAYHLSFYTNPKTVGIKAPNYVIDANSGKILKHWDNIHSERVGQGLGGNAFPLPYRAGMFQHGNALPGIPSLGKFEVKVEGDQCVVESPMIRVITLKNEALGWEAFPISVDVEDMYQLKAFSYACSEESLYLNYADDTSGPVNYSFSPINDTMYFAEQTIEMYQSRYGVKKPLGDDLPLRAYTHLGEMDNAFAIPTIHFKGELYSHQQIVIGNGEHFLTAPAQAVIGHELSHNFTDLNSGLIYEGQSGGINEAFSDMAAIALQDYIKITYPWYWDGQDWTIGREAVIGGMPLRYMDDPTKDGHSIDNAKDYTPDMNVHYTSGVFNKAFYLLSNMPGWSVKKAFQVMVDANQKYWSPIAYYDFAACGVIQATIDREWNEMPVIEAFDKVGVSCPMFPKV